MAYRCKLGSDAQRELDAILDYYTPIDLRLKHRFLAEFRKLRLRLCENPFQFPVLEGRYRRAVFPRIFPYSLIVVIREETIIILAIAHNKRAPDYWKAG